MEHRRIPGRKGKGSCTVGARFDSESPNLGSMLNKEVCDHRAVATVFVRALPYYQVEQRAPRALVALAVVRAFPSAYVRDMDFGLKRWGIEDKITPSLTDRQFCAIFMDL